MRRKGTRNKEDKEKEGRTGAGRATRSSVEDGSVTAPAQFDTGWGHLKVLSLRMPWAGALFSILSIVLTTFLLSNSFLAAGRKDGGRTVSECPYTEEGCKEGWFLQIEEGIEARGAGEEECEQLLRCCYWDCEGTTLQ